MTNPPTPISGRSSNLWLLASALVLGGLLVAQLGRLTGGTPAYADLVNQGNDFGILTSISTGDDLVVVLDQRNEELLVYTPYNQRAIEFKARHSLKDLFTTGRAATPLPGERDRLPASPAPSTAPSSTPVRENPPR